MILPIPAPQSNTTGLGVRGKGGPRVRCNDEPRALVLPIGVKFGDASDLAYFAGGVSEGTNADRNAREVLTSMAERNPKPPSTPSSVGATFAQYCPEGTVSQPSNREECATGLHLFIYSFLLHFSKFQIKK